MSTTETVTRLYLELADELHHRNRMQERDRFLLLAADAAYTAGREDDAERLRKNLILQNPDHMIRSYGSLEEALRSPDMQAYLGRLRRDYPFEQAEHLLNSLRAERLPKSDEDFVLPLDTDRGGVPEVRPPVYVIRQEKPERTLPPPRREAHKVQPPTPPVSLPDYRTVGNAPRVSRRPAGRSLAASRLPELPRPHGEGSLLSIVTGTVLFFGLLTVALAMAAVTFLLPLMAAKGR